MAERELRMTTFYLLWNEASNRLVIDKEKLKGWTVEKECQAPFWIAAKKEFGFDLTPLQKEMYDAKSNSTSASRRTIGHFEDAGKELWAAYSELQDGGEASEDTGYDLQQVLRQEG